ncbi:response regulator [Cohnella fermenti]|uniref:Response regulator n=1 Tax=Cohnella fermenti TaxID=2565925 RepID=A0A4V3WE49_9BACL|nr:response regulator [Cohnella fermenti]THF74823.1 response regulator [Cohnella fermenti]
MIRVIAVDDEQPALHRLGKLLESFGNVEVAGLFDRATACLDFALAEEGRIDLALLDMEMPKIHGLELGRRLRQCRPEIQIAFLTAHEQFAKDAFEVEALDYLLKPFAVGDLARILERWSKRSGRSYGGKQEDGGSEDGSEGADDRGLAVHGFGPFTVLTPGREPVRFRNSKSRELLAYLHQSHGKPVGKARLLEDIWYGRNPERAQVTLHTTVYQLRKDLEAAGLADPLVQSKTDGGSYAAHLPVSYSDVEAYEEELRQFKRTGSLSHALKAIRLYGEGYLPGSGYVWAAPRQAELELGYAELLEAVAGLYVKQHKYDMALNSLRKLAELSPLSGRLHTMMTALLLLMGREDDAREYSALARELLADSDVAERLDYAAIAADPLRCFS